MPGEISPRPEENSPGPQDPPRKMLRILGGGFLRYLAGPIAGVAVFYSAGALFPQQQDLKSLETTLQEYNSQLVRLDKQTAVLEKSESMLQGQLQQLQGQLAPSRRHHLEDLATVLIKSLPEITEAVNKMDPRGMLVDGLSAFLKEGGPVITALTRKASESPAVSQYPNLPRDPTTVSVVNIIAREEYTAHPGKGASTPVMCPVALTVETKPQGRRPSTPVKMASCMKKG
jgi:hypothetical protein